MRSVLTAARGTPLCTSSDTGENAIPPFEIQLQYAPIAQEGVKSVRIAKFHFLLFASHHYLARFGVPKSEEDFADHRFADVVASLQSERGFWSTYSTVEIAGRASMVSNSGLAVATAVQSGAVLGLLPSYLYLTDANFVPVLPSIHYEIGIYLNFSAAAAERPEVRSLINFLKNVVFDKRTPWFADVYSPPDPEWRSAGVLSLVGDQIGRANSSMRFGKA